MAKSTEIKEKASNEPNASKKNNKSLGFSRPVLKNRSSSKIVEPKKKHKKNYEESLDFSRSFNRSSIKDSPLNPFNLFDGFDSPKKNSNPTKKQEINISEEQTPSLFSQMIIDSSIGSLSSHQLSFTSSKPKQAENDGLRTQLESNLISQSSKHLKGMDVSLNEADREFIIYKESKETYIALRDQLNIIEKDIKHITSKLKSQEATYKYKLEEGELMNEDFISFKQQLLDLPINLFPKKFVTKLSSNPLKPEEILTNEKLIENAIDGYIAKLRQENVEKPNTITPKSGDLNQNKIPLNNMLKSAENSSSKLISPKKTFSRNNSSGAKAKTSSLEVHKSKLHYSEHEALSKTNTVKSTSGASTELTTKASDTETRIQLFQQRQALLKSSRSRLERLLGA